MSAAVRVLALIGFSVLGLLLAFAVLTRIWPGGTEVDLAGVLYRVRGTAAALIAAGVASWFILRNAPPLLADSAFSNGRLHERRDDPGWNQLHYARWFIVMRWIALVVASVLIFTAVEVAGFLPAQVGRPLGAVIVGLALLNLGYTLYLRHARAGTRLLALQTYADVAALIVLLHFSGGIENPLTPLLLLHVIIAGIVLGRLHCYLVAGVASLLFGLMAWGEWSGLFSHYTLSVFPHFTSDGVTVHAAHDALYAGSRVSLHAAIMLLVAYFTTTLVERIRQDERDMTVLADRALAQAQLLERALDTTGTALCVCDSEGQGFWRNRRWEEWTCGSPGMGCCDRSGDSAGARTFADGQVRVEEVRIPGAGTSEATGGGSGRILQVTTAPLHDRDGRIGHVVTLARDVTAEQEAQQGIVRAQRLAAVGELAGQVAHEVNNPIAIISTKARLLLRDGADPLPPRVAAEMEKIVQLSERVARIAQGLLSYCRPSPGVRCLLDVRLPVRRALSYVEGRAAQAGVRIRDDLPGTLPPIHASARELEQVFLNLFLNSLDAMPGGGELRVAARTVSAPGQAETDWLEAVVEDSGSGIPAEIRARIFDPFLTTKPEGQGSGLGLSICLGLVRSHGGQIDVQSEAGHPTRVTIRLPIALGRSAREEPELQCARPRSPSHV
jgi:signal transduction histidine kinase